MKFVRGILNITPNPDGCVLTLGNFDGIHLGHQQIVSLVKQQSDRLGIPSAVLFFEPQPREYFTHTRSPARLTTLHEKYSFMNKLGIDYLYCLRFSDRFADISADDFITEILLAKFNVRHLVVGDDFRFGKGREGSFETIENYCKKTGTFSVEQAPSYIIDNQRVSSTLIREALAEARIKDAEKMLGRPYSITGKVVHGQQLGRKIGFPTANIDLNRTVLPVSGVYAISAKVDDRILYGIANIGVRPTVNGTQPRLEAYLFDYSGDLYGRRLTVQIWKKIRNEQKFPNIEELREQIEKDKLFAQNLFSGSVTYPVSSTTHHLKEMGL